MTNHHRGRRNGKAMRNGEIVRMQGDCNATNEVLVLTFVNSVTELLYVVKFRLEFRPTADCVGRISGEFVTR